MFFSKIKQIFKDDWKQSAVAILLVFATLCCGYFMREWLYRGKFPQEETILLVLASSFISCSATILLGIGSGRSARQQVETQAALLDVQGTMRAIAEDQKNVSQTNMAARHFRNYLNSASLFAMECFEAYRMIKNSEKPDSKILINLITQKSRFTTSAKIIEGLFCNVETLYPEISKEISKSMDRLIHYFGEAFMPEKLHPEAKSCTLKNLFDEMKCQSANIESHSDKFSELMGRWLGQNFSRPIEIEAG